ncbi:MAG: hypothetical protein WAO52_09555 [Prolixibacteraceae bacterium]
MNNNNSIVKAFTTSFHNSFQDGMEETQARKLTDAFIQDFIHLTPLKLELIKSYAEASQFDLFYQALSDLKYLNEFSDNFSRYWCAIRGYSGALSKLKKNYSVKGSKKIYWNYYDRYGDRRLLRNEHWFERKRWEFLDELQLIYSERELDEFMQKYQRKLNENLKLYVLFILKFIRELKKTTDFRRKQVLISSGI